MRKILHTFLFIPALLLALEFSPLLLEELSDTGYALLSRAETNSSLCDWGVLEAEESERSEENEKNNEEAAPYDSAIVLTGIHHAHTVKQRLKTYKAFSHLSSSHISFLHLRAPPALI